MSKKAEFITGVEYWRCKRQVSRTDIQMLLGGCSISLNNWTKPKQLLNASNVRNLIRVADRLDVTVDQLFETHSTAELEDGDHLQYESKYNNPYNCLNNYRVGNGLSFQQLADRMGVSRQYAQEACQTSRAPKAAIKRICAYEKMTPEEFASAFGRTNEGE